MITALSTVAMIGVAIFAATQGAPPDLVGYASVGTLILGIVMFIASLIRGKKNSDKLGELEDAADYVKGINAQHQSLREEIAQIRKEHKDERAKWIEEKSILQSQLTQVREELNAQVIKNYKLEGQITKILNQLRKYMSDEAYEDFTKQI